MKSVAGFSFADDPVLLRPVEPEDLEVLYAWENDPDIWNVSNTLTPFSRDIIRSYLLNAHRDIQETRQFRFMIMLQDEKHHKDISIPVGTIDLFDYDPHNQRAGVGILIKSPGHRKHGYATKALNILCRYSFEILLLHQLYCNISPDNMDSLRLFQKAGFQIAGTKKEWNRTNSGWKDEILLQKLNDLH